LKIFPEEGRLPEKLSSFYEYFLFIEDVFLLKSTVDFPF